VEVCAAGPKTRGKKKGRWHQDGAAQSDEIGASPTPPWNACAAVHNRAHALLYALRRRPVEINQTEKWADPDDVEGVPEPAESTG